MQLSSEEKKKVIDELALPWGRMCLRCDGYLITLRVQQKAGNGMSFEVFAYVNGRMEAKWMMPDSVAPESKFLRKSLRQNVSANERLKAEKAFGKRYVRQSKYYSGSYTLHVPTWSSGKAALNHLCKVCDDIELLSEEDAIAALRAASSAAASTVPAAAREVHGATSPDDPAVEIGLRPQPGKSGVAGGAGKR